MSLWDTIKKAFSATTPLKNVTTNTRPTTGLASRNWDGYAQSGAANYKKPAVQPKSTPTKTVSTPVKSSGGSAGASIGGGGGGGAVKSSGGSAASKPKITPPPAPKIPTYKDLSPEMKKIYDNLRAHNPDYASLEKSQEAIRQLYEQQIAEAREYGSLQQSGLDTTRDQTARDTERARRENLGVFRDARSDIQDQLQDVMRSTQEQASARGLGDSGFAQLAGVQAQMAAGDATSGASEHYYSYEEELQRNMADAEKQYQLATQELSSSVQSAVTQITQASAQSDSDYTRMIEGLKQQVADSANSVEMMKQNLIQSAFQNAMAQAQHEMQATQFQESQRQFDAQMSLERDKMAQAQANADRAFNAQRQQISQAGEGLSLHEKRAMVDSLIASSAAGAPGAYSSESIRAAVADFGLQNDPIIQSRLRDLPTGPAPADTSKDKNKGIISSTWDRLISGKLW